MQADTFVILVKGFAAINRKELGFLGRLQSNGLTVHVKRRFLRHTKPVKCLDTPFHLMMFLYFHDYFKL